jgi:hypothetical protein
VGHGGKEVESPTGARGGHLRSILLREGGPLAVGLGSLSGFDGCRARRQVREPDIVPILGRVLTLRHPAGGCLTVPIRRPSPRTLLVPRRTMRTVMGLPSKAWLVRL